MRWGGLWSPTDSNTASFLGIFIRQKDLRVSSACHSRGHLSHFTHLITLLKSIRCLPKRQRRPCQLATRNSQRPLAMSVIPLRRHSLLASQNVGNLSLIRHDRTKWPRTWPSQWDKKRAQHTKPNQTKNKPLQKPKWESENTNNAFTTHSTAMQCFFVVSVTPLRSHSFVFFFFLVRSFHFFHASFTRIEFLNTKLSSIVIWKTNETKMCSAFFFCCFRLTFSLPVTKTAWTQNEQWIFHNCRDRTFPFSSILYAWCQPKLMTEMFKNVIYIYIDWW